MDLSKALDEVLLEAEAASYVGRPCIMLDPEHVFHDASGKVYIGVGEIIAALKGARSILGTRSVAEEPCSEGVNSNAQRKPSDRSEKET